MRKSVPLGYAEVSMACLSVSVRFQAISHVVRPPQYGRIVFCGHLAIEVWRWCIGPHQRAASQRIGRIFYPDEDSPARRLELDVVRQIERHGGYLLQ